MSGTKGFADQLEDVLRADKLQKIKYRDGNLKGDVVLKEPNAKMSFEVTSLPISSTVVEIGRLQHLSGMENGPWKKICDYLLVIPTTENLWSAVLIEMKKTLAGEEQAKEQLRRSIPVVKYLESLCAIESHRDWEVIMRYVVVAEKRARLDKDRIRPDTGPPPRREEYKGISVAIVVGDSLTAKALLAV